MESYMKFKPSDKLRDFIINEIVVTDDSSEGIKKYKASINTDKEGEMFLNLSDIKWLQSQFALYYESNGCRSKSFHDVMISCDIDLPTPQVEPRNPELEARIQRLKAEQANREYQAMTKNIDNVRAHDPEDTIAYQIKQINKQLIAVAQFIFSVLAGFAFGFIGIDLIVGNLDFGFRLLLGVMFALIIALAEIYFLAKKLNEDLSSPAHPSSIYTKPHQE